jgi:hypothetical protein
MPPKVTMEEPQFLPSPPPSPSPSDTPTERDSLGPSHINDTYLSPVSSTTNKGKGRMVDSPIDSQHSDQDDESDEYPPDEAETKRIEEVSECSHFLVPSLIGVFFFLP